MNYYKPLKEQLAGFYQFGSEYYVIEDENDYRAELTAIHERTHANLGVATSFGIFQQILFRINSELKDSHEKYFANMFFEFSLNNVINCHESAATFHEFSCAKHDKFSGIELMELELPVEYKKWKQIYSDLFNNCTEFEPYAQGVLGYHISRKCMDTNILKDIKHFQTLEAGEEYFRSNLNSPDRRQEIVCNCLSQKKELGKTFKKFLEYYKEIKEELHSNYKNPDIGSRQTTYRFQSKMTRIIDKILIVEFRTAGLPIYDFRKANFIDSANTLIDYWKTYLLNKKLCPDFNYKINNIDGRNNDIMDTFKVIKLNSRPLSGLLKIDNLDFLLNHIAWIYIHKSEDPFKLTDSLILKKNDVYTKFYSKNENKLIPYIISTEHRIIKDIIETKRFDIIYAGINYDQFQLYNLSELNQFILWNSFGKIPSNVINNKLLNVKLFKMSNFIIGIFNISKEYHFIIFNQFAILEEITKLTKSLSNNLQFPEEVTESVNMIIKNYRYIF